MAFIWLYSFFYSFFLLLILQTFAEIVSVVELSNLSDIRLLTKKKTILTYNVNINRGKFISQCSLYTLIIHAVGHYII